ncbi:MAG: M56 family metallopeptidase [Fimbriimonas sp.]
MNSFELLSRFTEASVQLAVGAGAVFLLGFRLPASVRAWLWRCLAAKACLSLCFIASLPLLSPEVLSSTPAIPLDVFPGGSFSPEPPGTLSLESVLLWVWAAGCGISLAIQIGRAVKGERLARTLAGSERAQAFGATVVHSESIAAPMIVGLAAPVVLLPAAMETELPLAHELAHAQRQDLRWVAAVGIVRSIFWFHPCAWLLEFQHRLACEEASDALAIASTRASVQEYAKALLAYSTSRMDSVAALGSSATTLKRRIKHMHRPQVSLALVFALTLGCLLLLIPARLVAGQGKVLVPSTESVNIGALWAIRLEKVRREINLTKEQEAQIEAVWQRAGQGTLKLGEEMAAMKRQGVPVGERIAFERKGKAAQLAKSAREVLGILTPQQAARARQIGLLSKGPLALGEREVGEQIGLSDETMTKIALLAKEAEREAVRISIQGAHERMEQWRAGKHLSEADRATFLRLQEKMKRDWESPLYKKYWAVHDLGDTDPRKVAAFRAYTKYASTSPNRLSQQEAEEYIRLMAADSKENEVANKRFAKLTDESKRKFSQDALRLLSPKQRKAWSRLVGKPLLPN